MKEIGEEDEVFLITIMWENYRNMGGDKVEFLEFFIIF